MGLNIINGSKGKDGRRTFTKRKPKDKHSYQPPCSRKKLEITFNPADRKEYLTGFSSRKKERRAFGLAMQKVKDREAKLEERKGNRAAQLEKLEEIERSKAMMKKSLSSGDGNDSHDVDTIEKVNQINQNQKELHTFRDEYTTHHFGGPISVTTTFGIPSDNEDEDSISSKREFYAREKHGPGHIDAEQKRAGNVKNYIAEAKSSLSKRKKNKSGGSSGTNHAGKKGQHGAANMKGVGNLNTLKMAKKTLATYKAKNSEKHGRYSGGGKRMKGKR